MRNIKQIPSVLGYQTKSLFDPVQTHAVYSVPETDIDRVKDYLKTEHKATKFRVVKSQIKGLVIVCCKVPQ